MKSFSQNGDAEGCELHGKEKKEESSDLDEWTVNEERANSNHFPYVHSTTGPWDVLEVMQNEKAEEERRVAGG